MSAQNEIENITHEDDVLQEKIHSITKYQKPYIQNLLIKMVEDNPKNTNIICDYIIAEQNEINIIDSPKVRRL